jgi:type II secretory pathway pseudopilin PulG
MRRLSTVKDVRQAGFTLVEILIICPIMMAVITFMMSYLFRQYGELTKQTSQVNLQVEAQADIFSIQDDVFFAHSFISTTNTNLSDPWAPTGGWMASSSRLIISSPASTASHRVPSRQPVYLNQVGCTPQSTLEQNDTLYDNIIVFTSGANLYKRILSAPVGLSTCGIDYRKQTCPSDHATTACPTDILLSSHLSSFTVTYLTATGSTTTTPEQASLAKVALTLSDTAFGEPITASSNITLRRLNQ